MYTYIMFIDTCSEGIIRKIFVYVDILQNSWQKTIRHHSYTLMSVSYC